MFCRVTSSLFFYAVNSKIVDKRQTFILNVYIGLAFSLTDWRLTGLYSVLELGAATGENKLMNKTFYCIAVFFVLIYA